MQRSKTLLGRLTPVDPDPHTFMDVVGCGLYDIHDDRDLETNPISCYQSGDDSPGYSFYQRSCVCLCHFRLPVFDIYLMV